MSWSRNRKALCPVLICIALSTLPSSILSGTLSTTPNPDSAEPPSKEDWKPRFWMESRLNIRQGYVAASAIHASESLDGMQLSYGIRGRSDEWPGWGALSLSRLSGGGQDVIGVRGDMKPWPIAWPWGGIGFLLGLGLEHRSEDPRAGLGGYLALGGEFTVWSKWHWQVALEVERDFGISSESRNQVALTIAYAHDRLTLGPDHD